MQFLWGYIYSTTTQHYVHKMYSLEYIGSTTPKAKQMLGTFLNMYVFSSFTLKINVMCANLGRKLIGVHTDTYRVVQVA